MQPAKILYIIDELGPGGTERRLIQLLGGLDERAYSSKLLLLKDIVHYDEASRLNTEIVKLERRSRLDPSLFIRLYRFCRDWRPRVIHAWGSLPALYAGPVAKILNIKMINAMIASAPARLTAQQKFRAAVSFPFSDIIQSNSHAGLKAYGVSGPKGNVIHNGFDFNRLSDVKDWEDVRGEFGIDTRYVVGMVAGFHPFKDYDTLVRAAERILEKRDDVTFLCVGHGTSLERIRRMAGFSDRIICPGKRNDVESIVNIFDIGVMLTDLEKHGEGISNSIMEYMALAKPVIATDGGGTRELVQDGRSGFLIPHKSDRLLEEKIDQLLDDESLRKEMGSRGKEIILNDFSIERMVAEHQALYEKLL